jgi:transposase-like protein
MEFEGQQALWEASVAAVSCSIGWSPRDLTWYWRILAKRENHGWDEGERYEGTARSVEAAFDEMARQLGWLLFA